MFKIHLLVIFLFSLTAASAYAASYANIHLDIVGSILDEGSNVTFSGVLTSPDGAPISDRTIFIEDDTQYTRSNIIIAIAKTDAGGKFNASWKATPKDNGTPFHFYAEFLGGKQFGFTRSETYESFIKLNNQTTHDVVPSEAVPGWFIQASSMWKDGKIRDMDYAFGIENLVDYQIIKSNNTSSFVSIPHWVRSDAALLSNGSISTDEYISMLGYLVDNKIIR